MYGWGLRRTETSKLDVADWGRNPAAPEFGRYGMLQRPLRQGEEGPAAAAAERASVMGWAVEAVADYAENVRPAVRLRGPPALWVTERGGRVRPAEINARFVAYRDALGLPAALTVAFERHAYVTHLTEDGVDRRFIQQQVGHECDSPPPSIPTLGNCIRRARSRRSPCQGGTLPGFRGFSAWLPDQVICQSDPAWCKICP